MGGVKNRGVIGNRPLAQQIKDFSGLRYGKITPTDIDAFVEFGDKLFVFVEVKWKNASMPYGQKLALVRACDAIRQSGRPCYVLLAKHDVESPEIDIDVSQCRVTEIHKRPGFNGWDDIGKLNLTVREVIDRLHEFHKIDA